MATTKKTKTASRKTTAAKKPLTKAAMKATKGGVRTYQRGPLAGGAPGTNAGPRSLTGFGMDKASVGTTPSSSTKISPSVRPRGEW